VKPRGSDFTVILASHVTVREYRVSVAVEKVGLTERPKLFREGGHRIEALLQGRQPITPEWGEALEQSDKCVLRVGLTYRAKLASRKAIVAFDSRDHPIVREKVEPTA
jgi:hypothetical protein